MPILQAILLALLQGVTEFLPISSSGHLILVPYMLGWRDQGLHFDVAVNTGTLLAVVLYFRQELLALAREGLASLGKGPAAWSPPQRLAWGLVLGTVPVAVAGLLFYDLVATAARSPALIAATTFGFGVLLWVVDYFGRRRRELDSLTLGDALFVGCAQALALVPGTSRSGITMTAALAAGFDRETAARFSFLLAVPVSALAAAKDLWEMVGAPPPLREVLVMLLAAAVAAVSAYLVIDWLLGWVRRQSMAVFAIYRVLLAGVIVLTLL